MLFASPIACHALLVNADERAHRGERLGDRRRTRRRARARTAACSSGLTGTVAEIVPSSLTETSCIPMSASKVACCCGRDRGVHGAERYPRRRPAAPRRAPGSGSAERRRPLGLIAVSGLETLPPDQRAVLQLILVQGRGYADLAATLRLDAAAVRERAHAGAAALAGRPGDVDADTRGRVVDYLLGQQDDGERIVTFAELGRVARRLPLGAGAARAARAASRARSCPRCRRPPSAAVTNGSARGGVAVASPPPRRSRQRPRRSASPPPRPPPRSPQPSAAEVSASRPARAPRASAARS